MKAVIFDMDGTLFQTHLILGRALEDVFEHLRTNGEWQGETPLAQYQNIMGAPLPVVWDTLLAGKSEEVKREADLYFLNRLIGNVEAGHGDLYPRAIEVLNAVREAGFGVFIASNGLVGYLEAIVAYYGLDEWVMGTFSIEQVDSFDKAELVKEIIMRYGVIGGAVVGDRLSDIRAAKANGLLAVGCRFDFAQEQELIQADAVIDSLSDVLSVLKQVEEK